MRSSPLGTQRRFLPVLTAVLVAVLLTGCGTLARGLRAASTDAPTTIVPTDTPTTIVTLATPPGPPSSPSPPSSLEGREPTVDACAVEEAMSAVGDESSPPPIDLAVAAEPPDGEGSPEVALALDVDADGETPRLAAMQKRTEEEDEYDIEEYDPWESFNEAMFDFNLKLDRWVLKPVAKVYDKVVPDEVQRMIANAFDNLGSIKRLVNSLLQAKWDGAARELGRFLLNTTVGVGGLFDVAKHEGIEKSREDFGQTLGVYGAGPGPYLILPLLEPMTIRDGIGRAVDSLLDPLTYVSMALLERLALRAGETVNDRSLNLELFQGFEESVIDFYSAVRHAYLERRRNLIKE